MSPAIQHQISNLNLLEIRKELFRRGEFSFITDIGDKHHAKQSEALRILTDHSTTEFAYGGAAGGAKSWTGAAWLTFMAECFPGTRWFAGRLTLKSLRESTYQTFLKVFKRYGIEGWKYNGQDHYILFANGSRIDLLEMVYRPSDPMFERFGSKEYTGGWIEEAGEISANAYDTIKTRIGRQLNDKYGILGKLFITLNPKKNWVHNYFWKPFKSGELPKGMRFLQSLVTDNPFIDSGYINQLRSIRDKVKKARLLFGDFDYDDDENALMTYDAISDALNAVHLADAGEEFITGDIARYGKDTTTIYRWRGWKVVQRIVYYKKGIDFISKDLKSLAAKHKIPMSRVIVDEDGVGGGVVDNIKCKGFVNGSTALENPKTHEKENYFNLKTQCSYMASQMVNDHQIGFADSVMSEEDKEKFTEEAEQVKRMEVDSDGKLKIVPKETVKELIGRSPDDWDCFMMRQWFELKPRKKLLYSC